MINNINYEKNYTVSNGKLQNENLQTNLTKSKQVVSDNVGSNSAVQNLSSNTKDPNKLKNTVMLIPPLMLADDLADKIMCANDNNGFFAKIAKAGDKVSDTLHLEKVFSPEKKGKISNFLKTNRLTKYFTKSYKAIPKSSMASGHSSFSEQYLSKLKDALTEFPLTEEFADLMQGNKLSDTTTKVLKSLRNPNSKGNLLPTELASAADELIENGVKVFNKVNENGTKGKAVNLSAINTKFKAASSQFGKTSLGKVLSKGSLKTKDVLTFGAGITGLFFMASGLIESAKATKEAPKGEKLSTFMHVFSEQYLGILLFQPSINIMYNVCGNKYRGMSKEGLSAMQDLVKKTNADKNMTKAGAKIAKLQRDLLLKGVDKDKVSQLAGKSLEEAKELARSLKGEGAKLKFWEKPLKFAGKILSTGLDSIKTAKPRTIKLPKSLAEKFPNVANKVLPRPTLKGFAGGLGRFALIMFVIQPFIQKPITKLCHKIFGEPKTYLAKQNQSDKSKNQSTENKLPDNNTQNTFLPQENTRKTNLINMYTNPKNETASVFPNQTANIFKETEKNTPTSVKQPEKNSQNNSSKIENEIPAFSLNKNEKNSNESERYIPSIDPIVVEDNSKEVEEYVNEIIKSTDKILKDSQKSIN